MTFQQAIEQFNDLCRKYHAQQVSYQQFCQAVDQLRVQDRSGNWWQLSYDGKWLRWSGQEWIPGSPPELSGGNTFNNDAARQAANYAQTALNTAQSLASGNPTAIAGRAATLLRPLAGKSQKWWNILSIMGGGVGGALWYGYSSLDKYTKADPTTSLIMLAVPIVLIVLRKPLDRILAKLNPIRNKIPRLLLVGIGVAIPYLTATYLYGSAGLRNYPYIRWTVFLGPILSYLIIRTPDVTANKNG
jgi:hypothetical protein